VSDWTKSKVNEKEKKTYIDPPPELVIPVLQMEESMKIAYPDKRAIYTPFTIVVSRPGDAR
jgi:hypothetical protein